MTLERIPGEFSVCRVPDLSGVPLGAPYCFLAVTDEERSVVCRTANAPPNAEAREDGWRAFRVKGTLDFSLVGILAAISACLAAHRIGIFAVSTYNTDYILTKAENYDRALAALAAEGYTVL